MKTYIGIDNGISGALAVIRGANVRVMPVQTWEDGGDKFLDEFWLQELLLAEQRIGEIHVVVERAQKFSPGKLALISTWSCWAAIRAVLRLNHIPYTRVDPQQWQRVQFSALGKRDPGQTKVFSIGVAKMMFPGISLRRSVRCTTDCDGMSDALLLADYGRKKDL